MGQIEGTSSIICYYFGTDVWGPVRWHRYLKPLGECTVSVLPNETLACTVGSNLELLNRAKQGLNEELKPVHYFEASICVVDLKFSDIDANVLMSLNELVGEIKSNLALGHLNNSMSACPILVLLPSSLMVYGDHVASTGVTLVLERMREFSDVIKEASESMPRYAKRVHPWLDGLGLSGLVKR